MTMVPSTNVMANGMTLVRFLSIGFFSALEASRGDNIDHQRMQRAATKQPNHGISGYWQTGLH